jgi:hypothetical protein
VTVGLFAANGTAAAAQACHLFLQTLAEHPAEPESMIRPVAFWRRRGREVPDTLAQPKHEARQRSLRRRVRLKLILQAHLQPFGVAFLSFGRGRIGEYGGKRSQFPVNGRGSASILTYWHVPTPTVTSAIP